MTGIFSGLRPIRLPWAFALAPRGIGVITFNAKKRQEYIMPFLPMGYSGGLPLFTLVASRSLAIITSRVAFPFLL